jgi:hypothetical protein
MSWLKIDDGFEDHPKVEPLTDSAHRLWSRAACWCQKTGSNGFVPRRMLSTIAKNSAPLKRLERLAQELVDATAGGVFEHGLWEPAVDGWRFHDWKDYQPEHAKQTTLTRSEAASVAGKASADARRTKHGTAQPVRPERPPNDSGTFESSFEGSFDERRSGDVRRTELERPEPPVPDPVPRSDLTGDGISRPDRLEPALPSPPPRLPSRRERAAADLMTCPASELAARCKANPHDAGMTALEDRPDVASVHAAWAKAVGLTPRRLGSYTDRNAPLVAILEALEVTPLDALLLACDQASRDDWCRGIKGSDRDPARKRDVGCLSRKVLNRLLIDADAQAERDRKRKVNAQRIAAAEQAERERELQPRQPPPTPRQVHALVAGLVTAPKQPQPVAAQRRMTAEELDAALEAG